MPVGKLTVGVAEAGEAGAAPWTGVRKWVGRGFWAVTDQALFAGSNFLVNVLLARWLEPAAYGAFSVAYSLFLLLGTLHTALWTEPMVVYGSGRFREAFGAYQRVLVGYHWRFAVLVGLAFLLAAAGFRAAGRQEMALSLLGLTFAAPSVLYLWLVRRGAYVFLEPRLAAYGGTSYLALYVGLALVLLRAGSLNAATAFLAMAAAAFLAAEGIRHRLQAGADRAVDPGEVRSLHWGYGRWALLAGALSWVPANVYYVTLPAFHGLEAAARFKALMNLLMPVLHFNGALAQLLVPGMVRARERGGLARFTSACLGAFIAFALAYWAVLVAAGARLAGWLYKGRYVEDAHWLGWLGLLPALTAVGAVMGSSLRAQERPQAVAFVYAVLAGFSVTVGVALAWAGGLAGAVRGILLVNTLGVFVFWWSAKREVIRNA